MENDTMTPAQKNFERAKYFLENNISVHIKKHNGSFFNGKIYEVNENTITIHDRIIGMETIFLFDISNPIVEFTEKGVENGRR